MWRKSLEYVIAVNGTKWSSQFYFFRSTPIHRIKIIELYWIKPFQVCLIQRYVLYLKVFICDKIDNTYVFWLFNLVKSKPASVTMQMINNRRSTSLNHRNFSNGYTKWYTSTHSVDPYREIKSPDLLFPLIPLCTYSICIKERYIVY